MVAGGRHVIAAAALLALLVVTSAAWAQGAVIEARIDRQHVAEGETISLTVEASFPGRERVVVNQPEGGDFRVVGSQNFQFSSGGFRGGMQTTFTQTFRLRPLRTGTLTVGPVTVTIGAGSYRTESLSVEVYSSGARPPVATQPLGPPTGRLRPPSTGAPSGPIQPSIPTPPVPTPTPLPVNPMPGTAAPTPSSQVPTLPSSYQAGLPFVVVNSSRSQVHVGQQFAIDYEYFEPFPSFWNLEGIHQPSFQGFWFEAVPDGGILDYSRQTVRVGHEVYRSRLVARFVVVPLEAGELTLPAIELEASAARSARQTFASEPMQLDVLPLPAGAPQGFSSNNVGELSFSVEIEDRGTRVGDPIRVTMRAEGTGLVSLIDLPDVRVDGARLQPPVENRNQRLEGGAIRGFKSIETVVIPTREGPLQIGPFAFHYFDPRQAIYRTIEDDGETFQIAGQSPTAALLLGDTEAEEVSLLDALPPPRTTETAVGSMALPPALFWSLSLAPPVMFMLVSLAGLIRRRRDQQAPTRRKRSALGRARRRAEKATRQADDAGYGELAKAIRDYLRERFEIKAGALTTDETRRALIELDVPSDLAEEVADILETCELARFNQASEAEGVLKDATKRTTDALRRLEAHV